MANLASNLASVQDSIKRLNVSLPDHPELVGRLGQAHAFYVLEQGDDEPLFGFSKFVGYDGLTPESYLKNYKSLDGRNTEHALTQWFEEVRYGSPTYDELFEKLRTWLAQYGKRPRGGAAQKTRIMVVRPKYQNSTDDKSEDRRVLELLIAVADTLPANQRHELRAAL